MTLKWPTGSDTARQCLWQQKMRHSQSDADQCLFHQCSSKHHASGLWPLSGQQDQTQLDNASDSKKCATHKVMPTSVCFISAVQNIMLVGCDWWFGSIFVSVVEKPSPNKWGKLSCTTHSKFTLAFSLVCQLGFWTKRNDMYFSQIFLSWFVFVLVDFYPPLIWN